MLALELQRPVAPEVQVIEATLVPRSRAIKPKAQEEPPNPDHFAFRQMWCEAYAATFGATYAFNGGRDAKAISNLLKQSQLRPEGLMEVATKAWKENGYPFTSATVIHSFALNFAMIVAELKKRENGHVNGNGKVPAWQERKEWQDQLKRAEDEIKTLTSGDSHADLDFVEKATLRRARGVRDEMRQKLGYKI